MIRCVVTDLDGTLLNGFSISKRNKEALLLLKEKGIEIVFATGRDEEVMDLYDDIRYDAIILNGAAFLNEDGQTLFESLICYEDLCRMSDLIRDSEIGVLYYTDRGQFAINQDRVEEGFGTSLAEYVADAPDEAVAFFKGLTEIKDDSFFKDCKVYKAEVMDITRQAEVERIRAELKKYPDLAISTSVKDNIEINSRSANKADALKKMMKLKGYAINEVAVFGDGDNDLGMFEIMEETYAVANADRRIRDIAKYHLPSCVDDGFYYGVLNILKEYEDVS